MSKVKVSEIIKEGNKSYRKIETTAPIKKMVRPSDIVFAVSSYNKEKNERVVFNVSAVTIKDHIRLLVNNGKKNGPKEIPLNIAVKFDEKKTTKDDKGTLYKRIVGAFVPDTFKTQDGNFTISEKTKKYIEENGYKLLTINTPMSMELFIPDGVDNKIIASMQFEKEPNERNSYVMGQKMLSQLDSVYKVMDEYGFVEIPANIQGKVGVKYTENGVPFTGHFIQLEGNNNVEFKVVENGSIQIDAGKPFAEAIIEQVKKERAQQAPAQNQPQAQQPQQQTLNDQNVQENELPPVGDGNPFDDIDEVYSGIDR